MRGTLFTDTETQSSPLSTVLGLLEAHSAGKLGGEQMPEDAHPDVPPGSADLAHYLTLGMALNYQRNSYALWKAATRTFLDPETNHVFDPSSVASRSFEQVQRALIKHKLALQPNKHVRTWIAISEAICLVGSGDVRTLFRSCNHDIQQIKVLVQQTHKKRFPYLSGNKICNYWLYVCSEYLQPSLSNRRALNVAPDTHVVQASHRLGLITEGELCSARAAEIVASRWQELLSGTDIAPIDVHTPLWLWSRAGFPSLRVLDSNQ